MAKFQAFKVDSGEYRWRLIDSGRVVGVRPGRVRVAALSRSKRKAVEKALDNALAKLAAEDGASRVKA